MSFRRVLTLAVFSLLTVAATAADLSGLWEARLRFGPDARGPLILSKDAKGWSADFGGQVFAAREEARAITFSTPHGDFRGKREGNDITGHWRQEKTTFSGASFATPVRLIANGPSRWRGAIVPFDDAFTVFMMLKARNDGSYDAFLRNPERNFTPRMRRTTLTADEAARMYNADADVITLPILNRGGHYDFRRATEASKFYPRGKTPAPYVYRRPLARDDGWQTATLEEVNIDRAEIETFIRFLIEMPIDSLATPEMHAVLIARNGKLVIEEYFHGEHRDKLHETRSASKSLTAVLVGAAMQAGAPISLSTRVYDDSEPDAQKRAMTVEHLLTMSSGYFCDDSNPDAPGNEDALAEREQDWHRATLALPMASAPGGPPVYCSMTSNLNGAMLMRATKEPIPDLFERLIARPMQFGRYAIFLQPSGEAYMGGGWHLLPRDFLKLGQLMLNGGTWKGRRILSSEFAKRSISPLANLQTMQYGLLWWSLEMPYKDRKVRAFIASGNGTQMVLGVPDLDLLVAMHGGNYGTATSSIGYREYVPQRILPAID